METTLKIGNKCICAILTRTLDPSWKVYAYIYYSRLSIADCIPKKSRRKGTDKM